MPGKLTMENEFLKKALQNVLKHNERNGSSSPLTNSWSKPQERDVLMRVPCSMFYYKPKEKSQERLREDADLQDEIEKIVLSFPNTDVDT